MRTLLTLAVVALVATACSKPNPEAEAALAEKAAHAARHALIEATAKAYLVSTTAATAAPNYAEGAMIYSPEFPQGKPAPEALAKMETDMESMREMKMESEVTSIGDDFFAIAGKMSAKYSGPLNKMDPKSKILKDVQVGGPWVALVKVNDAGKITEERIMWDNLSMVMQLEAAAKAK
jgi:hypothetical protein